MGNRSIYGRQPFHDILLGEGRTAAGTGRFLGFDSGYAQRVANGRVAPSDSFRQAIARLLRRPEKELFTPAALAADYIERKNARGLRELDGGDR